MRRLNRNLCIPTYDRLNKAESPRPTSRLVSLARMARVLRRQRLHDQRLQDRLVHVTQLLDVQAAFTGRMFAELGQQRLSTAEPDSTIQNICSLTRRKTN